MDTIKIPISKRKMLLLIGGAMLLIAASIFLLIVPEASQRYNPLVIKSVSIAGIAFFGLCLVWAIRQFFDKQAGLIIDAEGIIDATSAIGVGRIRWDEIEAFEIAEISSTKLLLIFVKNPEQLMAGQRGIKRKMMDMNMSMCGTPFAIATTSLQCTFDELADLLQTRLDAYQLDNLTTDASH